MIQDIAPHIYHNEFSPRSPRQEDMLLIFREDQVLVRSEAPQLTLPTLGQMAGILPDPSVQPLFSIDETLYDLLDGPAPEAPAGWDYLPSGEYRNRTPRDRAFACAVGESLHRWREANRFCGRCGHRMENSRTERALVCPACGQIVYPKICPAVIVAIIDGDRLLLTRYAGRKIQRYALVAGYAEIGETVEETVAREVLEEVGLHIRDLRFCKSQPWAFTDTLLMGFFARLDGSDQIRLQEEELAEARWFSRDAIPDGYSQISLTGEMIEQFRGRMDPFSRETG